MKVEKKKGVRSFRIVEHNKKLLYWIIGLTIIFIFLIFSIVRLNNSEISVSQNSSVECNSDSDCVASSCCHPTSCVDKTKAPKCGVVACTMDCRPNTLDCQQGSCACVNNKCSVEWSQ